MLEKYIKQLLSENDEVVVPKLGTFVAGYAGSEISGLRVAPPSKKIHFYEKLKSDKNELLRKRVTEAEGISIFDFQAELEKMTTKINEELKTLGSSHISHLGIIKKKPDGSLEFEQDDDNLLDDSFGLPSLERKPLNKRENKEEEIESKIIAATDEPVFDRDAQKEKVEEETDNLKDAAVYASLGDRLIKDPVEDEASLKKEKEEFIKSTSEVENPPAKKEAIPPVVDIEEEEEEEEEEENSSSLVLWLIAIPIIFAFVFLLYIFNNDGAMASVRALLGQKPTTTIVTNDTKTDPVTEVDNSIDETAPIEETNNSTDEISDTENSNDNSVDNSANNGTDPATQYTANSETQPEDIINEAKNRFYIVIGSFSEIENARKLRSDLQGSGVSNAKIVMYPKRGMYRVTVGDQASEREAYNQRNTLGSAYPDMWVLNY
ncbi:sporulation related protein [Bernardetia litoralis DSM 6794]|uniref:Sporulation related protein n=1 Tax=Bernardetia litoralis (strain ATCC 23117 / DSM 6794 / NBRC 15988 / NCIMB 1366 / Fx l1 / Sio-4) TaxID=880071 RepID=I4ANC8_BERLS|nr:SPOR domain-containing protein [Bernardetia litoralis]AFM05463.1 sporulation related protein [Bernardetia litoralis DSM 6794]